ncbi:hypothetical protein [Caballeronia sordidicola]|uniref:Uncharacterized protein n=2 Tax=Burkholderiaceae TaxID=119060 RepID=A0A242N4Y2_CABSO|nr:hypothetical protein [Caballeronia sordidicola]OTP78739.1 hypothetical protein PAMC26577_03870 [Caballeronia sordidicola]
MTAFSEVLAECTELKDRVETERVAVSAITAALVSASETLVERGWMTAKKVHGLTVSMEESALDLRAALDEVDASITTAIAPVEVFAQATERMRIAQSQEAVVDVPARRRARCSISSRHSTRRYAKSCCATSANWPPSRPSG